MERDRFSIHVDSLLKKGILSPRGFSVYPTPDVLANVLARKALAGFGIEKIRDLIGALPQRARESLAERIKEIGRDVHTSELEEELFGPKGLFRDAAILVDSELAALVRITALAFPESAMANYDAVLSERSDASLVEVVKKPRRVVVWALEALVWLPETFERAALQLKRLALAETETYANNATGCFEALFAPVLGATSAPYDLRMPVLEGMVAGSTPERTLLTKTIRTALGRGGRSGGPPEIQGRAVSEWRPANIEAYRLIMGQILSILGKLLADSVPEVSEEAGKVLADITWELILSGCQKEWAVCCKGLHGGAFESRSRVLERVDALLQYHSRRLSKEVKEEILAVRAELAPQSFAERLRFETSRWPGGSTKDPGKSTRDAERRVKMSELAKILLSDDGVREESLAWLLSGEVHSAWELGEALGEMDTSVSMPANYLGVGQKRRVRGAIASSGAISVVFGPLVIRPGSKTC